MTPLEYENSVIGYSSASLKPPLEHWIFWEVARTDIRPTFEGTASVPMKARRKKSKAGALFKKRTDSNITHKVKNPSTPAAATWANGGKNNGTKDSSDPESDYDNDKEMLYDNL